MIFSAFFLKEKDDDYLYGRENREIEIVGGIYEDVAWRQRGAEKRKGVSTASLHAEHAGYCCALFCIPIAKLSPEYRELHTSLRRRAQILILNC